MDTQVDVKAADMRSLHRALANDSRSYVSIDPLTEIHQDNLGQQTSSDYKFAAPTSQFRISWIGRNGESFVRVVEGVQELFKVLRPIFQANVAAKRYNEALRAKAEAEAKRARVANARRVVMFAARNLKEAQQKLKEVLS